MEAGRHLAEDLTITSHSLVLSNWSGRPPHNLIVGAVLASLAVESKSNCMFSFVSDFCLIVDWRFHPPIALTRSFKSFTPSTWTFFC